MKSKEQIISLLKDFSILELSDCEGSCPCGEAYIFGINFKFHCWRTKVNDCDCKYSGLHLSQDKNYYSQNDLTEIGEIALIGIKKIWFNTDWELKIDENKSA